jgi:hypothetical protein
MTVLIAMSACWNLAEEERHRRVWEMQDHEVDAIAARDALLRGDLAAAQQAGARLAEPDLVPGLPEQVRPWLDAVRDGGQALARELDAPSAAATLLAVTGDCAGCHTELAVPVPEPLHRTGEELAWIGLVFESEPRWDAGVAALGPEAAAVAAAEGWADRRAAYAAHLVRTGADAR